MPKGKPPLSGVTDFIVPNIWALGDTVVMSAMLRDIHRAHPGKFRLAMDGNYSSFWRSNPHKIHVSALKNPRKLDLSYRWYIDNHHKVKRHYLTAFHEIFEKQTGVHVPVTVPRGELFIRDSTPVSVAGRYWLLFAGGKRDITNKWWPYKRYAQVADTLRRYGIQCVQAGYMSQNDVHPPIPGCPSIVGRTQDIEHLFSAIQGAEGVICPVTGPMHVAAALEKPCVVLGGGREQWQWEAYTNDGQWPQGCQPVRVPHKYLHTQGLLSCCKTSGCWIADTDPVKGTNRRYCSRREPEEGRNWAACMRMLTVDHVVDAVIAYHKEGFVSPIGEPKRLYVELPMVSSAPPEILAPPPPSKPLPKKAKAHAPAPDNKDKFAILDNPLFGGKMTVFVLCYGNYPELAKSCVGTILDSVPAERLDLRIGCNAVCDETRAWLSTLHGGQVSKIYDERENIKKYPLMRKMFNDPELPVTTGYFTWFDDDTRVVDRDWLRKLAAEIVSWHPGKYRLFGPRYRHDLQPYGKPGLGWFTDAPWWRKKPLFLRKSETAGPAGTVIEFAAGWFWAMHTATMRMVGIPDARLNHNGGDITIGAQAGQFGGKVRNFNANKELVWCPKKLDGGRRGFFESPPWCTAAPDIT